MPRFFRLALLQRFVSSVREEGVGPAFTKARLYINRRLRGIASSTVDNIDPATDLPRHEGEHMYLSTVWQKLAQQEAFHVQAAPATLQKRRKIALIGDLNLPQCRKYRVAQLAEFWEAQGVEVSISHYLDVPRSAAIMQDATHLMEYRLQNTPTCGMYRYEARRLRLPVLYDLDDPLFSISAYETYENMKALDPAFKRHFLGEAPKYLEMMNGADILSVSTPGMVAHTQLYTQRPVYMRRNFADSITLQDGARAMANARAAARKDDLFRAVFASGSQGHEIDFELIQDEVITFLDASPTHRLMILGHFNTDLLPQALQNQIETHPFSTYETYLDTLATADCAVMPLIDDAFNRCKSAVRVIDASSVGVPSVVGTVSDMANMVTDGKTGLIVHTPADWGKALTTLAADRKTTRAMGSAARLDLETRWSGQPAAHIISPEIMDWVTA